MKFLQKLISPKTLIVLAIALVLGQCIDPSIAFAQEAGANETLKAFAQLFSIFVNIFTFLSLIFLNYGGDLIGTEFLTAPDPMSSIRPMWVIIRNITNIGFVLVLLFLAFANLFSSLSEGSTWTIKEKLPKIILALIAINFSLLGFKVVLDAVHIGTITIFSIPDSTLRDKGVGQLEAMLKTEVDIGGSQKKQFYRVMNELMCNKNSTEWEEADGSISDPLPSGCLFALDPSGVGGMADKSDAAHNLFLAFGIQFNKLQALPSLAAKMNDWSEVITSVLFASILSLAQVVALGAVFIALLVRVVVLWVAMVFSPLIVAASIMGFGGDGGKIGTQVITNLVMPLKIAAAFAITFLMMDTMINVGAPATDFIHVGASVSTFGQTGYGLLWSIATIVVFWKAAFWAMDGSAAEFITNEIKSKAEGAGKFIAKAGTIDREFFPMPGAGDDGKVALSTLWKAGTSGIEEVHRRNMNEDEKGAFEKFGIRKPEDSKMKTNIEEDINKKTTGEMTENALLSFFQKYGLKAFRENRELTKQLYDKLAPGVQKNYGGSADAFADNMAKDASLAKQVLKDGSKVNGNKPKFEALEETGTETDADASKKEEEKDQKRTFTPTKTGDTEPIPITFNGEYLINNAVDATRSPEALVGALGRAGISQAELKGLTDPDIEAFGEMIGKIEGYTKDDVTTAFKEMKKTDADKN